MQTAIKQLQEGDVLADDEEEANELMRQCEKVTGRAEYTCRFRWEEGSVAMW